MIVESIEQKMGLASDSVQSLAEDVEQRASLSKRQPIRALFDSATLDTACIPEGFAREFLLNAQKPCFIYLAPGLRCPSVAEFTAQPLIGRHEQRSLNQHLYNPEETPPILLLCTGTNATTHKAERSHSLFEEPEYITQDGLYLARCDRRHGMPFEDGVQLRLPWKPERGWAKLSDGSSAYGYDSLYQSGELPFIPWHPVQLQAVLEYMYLNIERGFWPVDAQGVAGGLAKWREADTQEGWRKYFVDVGPGGYW